MAPYLPLSMTPCYNMSSMAACLPPVMQATIFVISTAPYLQHVLHGNMFSTCQAWHRIGHQAIHHVYYMSIMFSPCQAWHRIGHQARHHVNYMSIMAQCILSVKHGTVFVIKHDAMSTTCQAEHPVYYLSIFHLSSMVLFSPPVKHGTICSSIEHGTMYVTCSRMAPPVKLGTIVFHLSSMAPCVPPVKLGTIWSSI